MATLLELLARNLGVSKTAVRQLLAEERVATPSNETLLDPRAPIAPGTTVIVDGEPVALRVDVHVLLHKPVGVVTALRDDRHPTAYELVRQAPLHGHLRPVGRLDLDTSGLLLWTTDGDLLFRLTHPKRAVPRVYQAALARPFTEARSDLVLDDGHRPSIADLRVIDRAALHPALLVPDAAACFASITVTGGAYHEVRRIFAALGSHVLALARVAYGPFTLPPALAPGAFVEAEAP